MGTPESSATGLKFHFPKSFKSSKVDEWLTLGFDNQEKLMRHVDLFSLTRPRVSEGGRATSTFTRPGGAKLPSLF